MSGSLTPPYGGYPAVQILDSDRVDVRRYCGYPAYGAGNAGFQSWRYFTTYGTLEYRLGNLTGDEVAVLQVHLANCRALDAAVVGSGANLDTDQAAVWFHNKNEVADREALLTRERVRLCAFLGVPPGPDFVGARQTNARVVV